MSWRVSTPSSSLARRVASRLRRRGRRAQEEDRRYVDPCGCNAPFSGAVEGVVHPAGRGDHVRRKMRLVMDCITYCKSYIYIDLLLSQQLLAPALQHL